MLGVNVTSDSGVVTMATTASTMTTVSTTTTPTPMADVEDLIRQHLGKMPGMLASLFPVKRTCCFSSVYVFVLNTEG